MLYKYANSFWVIHYVFGPRGGKGQPPYTVHAAGKGFANLLGCSVPSPVDTVNVLEMGVDRVPYQYYRNLVI